MPLIHKRAISTIAVLGIWEVEETEDQLLAGYPASEQEMIVLNSFSHRFRRTQFLASRLLLHTLLPGARIVYDENGKPWPDIKNIHISISHTGKLIAILIDEKHCGVDIETIHSKIERIAPKFLSDVELTEASVPPATERMHAYWCVKEAIYKVYGEKNVSLKTDIFVEHIDNPNAGTVKATLKNNGQIVCREVRFELFGNCMLAWTE